MRTTIFDLASFLHGEGISFAVATDVVDVLHCTDEDEDQALNIVNVTLRPGLVFHDSSLANDYSVPRQGARGDRAGPPPDRESVRM